MRQLAIMALILMWPAHALADISGIYALFDNEAAVMIHVVEGRDGELHGQIEAFNLNRKHRLDRLSRNLTGVTRRGSVALTVDMPIVNWFESTTLTGSVSRRALNLSVSGRNAELRKISSEKRDAVLAKLRNAAATRQQAARIRQAQSDLRQLEFKLSEFMNRADIYIGNFSQWRLSYSKLLEEGRALDENVRRYESRGIRSESYYRDHEALYKVRERVWSNDADVRRMSLEVRKTRTAVEEASKKLNAFCGKFTVDDLKTVCDRASDLKAQYDAKFKIVVQSFEEMVGYRKSMNF